jgi:hypothetical protein
MKHAIYPSHSSAHAFLIDNVTLMKTHAHFGKRLGFRGIANESLDLMAALDQLPDHRSADESGSTGNEVSQVYLAELRSV